MSAHQATPLTSNLPLPLPQTKTGPGGEHTSGFFWRLSSIRALIARERHLFGDAQIGPAAPEDKVEQLQQHDQEDKARAKAIANATVVAESDAANPSMEAEKANNLNKNNFDTTEISRWPGLGTWANDKQDKAQIPKNVELKAEAAFEEAIDNATGDDSLGWPSQH